MPFVIGVVGGEVTGSPFTSFEGDFAVMVKGRKTQDG